MTLPLGGCFQPNNNRKLPSVPPAEDFGFVARRVPGEGALRADGDVEILSGADLDAGVEAPDTRLWHYNGGVEAYVTEPRATRWTVVAHVGAGATTFDPDEFTTAAGTADFSQTYFSLNGGVKGASPCHELRAGLFA